MQLGQAERPPWQVRISAAINGTDSRICEAPSPSGGGVWVGGRWILTCAHVVGAEPQPVMVRFTFAGGEPIQAVVAKQGWLPQSSGDLALLELDRDPPSAARPAALRLARTLSGHPCAVYGYPAGHEGGVWSTPEVTGQTVDRLQLTAQAAQGHKIEKGFSGSGLYDSKTAAVVGLVVTRDRDNDVLGAFAVPMQAVAAAFPQLRAWVGWRLSTDRFLREHWRPRARGVYQDTTPGWYFTGRAALVRELTQWFDHDLPDPAMRVVTGPAGAGKSALLAWLCALSDPQLRAEIAAARPKGLTDVGVIPAEGQIKAAIWARDLDTSGAADSLAAALALPVPPGAASDDVLAAVSDLDQTERTNLIVVVDALDEAKTPREIARRLLLPLARDLRVKVLVGTRPQRADELLAAFGDQAAIYYLDNPAWFDWRDLACYAASCLRIDFDPTQPSGYRHNSGVCRQVAEAIAKAAISNFLVAGLAARARAGEPVIDISLDGWQDRQRFPAEVGEAFGDYLHRFGDDEPRAKDLLRALAHAEGTGLAADMLWASMASALAPPRRYNTNDVAWLLATAADYLVESSDEQGQPIYRLFHHAIIDYLRPAKGEEQRQRAICRTLVRQVQSGDDGADWVSASAYIKRHLAAHAAMAGLLDSLLKDPGFLLAADPAGLLRVLDSAATSSGLHVAWFYRTAADEARTNDLTERAAYLQLAAGKAGHRHLANVFGVTAASWHWTARVLTWHPPGSYIALGRIAFAHQSAVTVTAAGDVLIVVGGRDGSVALWRPRPDGLVPVGEPQPGHGGFLGIEAVAAGEVDGQVVAVTGGSDGSVALWQLTPEGLVPVGEPQPGHGGLFGIGTVAVGEVDGHIVAATAGAYAGAVGLWRLGPQGLTSAGEPQEKGSRVGGIRVVAMGEIDGQVVAVTGGRDGSVALWRLGPDGLVLVGEPQPGHGGFLGIEAVATGEFDGQVVAVTGGSNGSVALWQLTPEGLILAGEPQQSHFDSVRVAAVGEAGGQVVAVTGGRDGSVALWQLTREGLVPVGEPQSGPPGEVKAVAVGEVDGQAAAVTIGSAGTVQLWRLSENRPALAVPRPNLHDIFRAVAVGKADGQMVAVTGASNGSVTLWQLTPEGLARVGKPQFGHNGMVLAVAVGEADGQVVAVTAGHDHTVALWWMTPNGLERAGEPHPDSSGALGVGAVAIGNAVGQVVAVTGGYDGAVAFWRLKPNGLVLAGYSESRHFFNVLGIAAVAVGAVNGQVVAVTGEAHGTVTLWQLRRDGTVCAGEPQSAHGSGSVQAVAIGEVDGHVVAVTGGSDGAVAVWRLGPDRLLLAGNPQPGHSGAVLSVAVGKINSQVVVVTGGHDGTVQLWRLGGEGLTKVPTAHISVGSPIRVVRILAGQTIAWCQDGVLAITMQEF